jgi:Fic family protein
VRSFVDLDAAFAGQPPPLGAVLARVDTARGREQLSVAQLPELLTALAAETRIASITASSAIEGVVVAPSRAERIVSAPERASRRYRNRNERELAGYRDAVDEMMRLERFDEAVSIPWLSHVHRRLFGHLDGGGGRLKTDRNYIVSFERGQRQIIFEPPSPTQTPFVLRELCGRYEEARAAQTAHPIILIAAFILDLLAIHPFADGNGRVARLVTTYLLMQEGYRVPRYVSVEQRIFETRNAYYDALEQSQRGWHEGEHVIWPWVSYLVDVLAASYERFEELLAARDGTGLSKQSRVRRYVLEQAPQSFAIAEIRRALPGISDETIRLVLSDLKQAGRVASTGRGRGARWERRP